MSFSVDAFAAAPARAQLEECRKSDLHELAAHYGFSVSRALRKSELRAAVVEALVAQGVLEEVPDGLGEEVSVESSPASVLVQNKLALKSLTSHVLSGRGTGGTDEGREGAPEELNTSVCIWQTM
ncbi:hypothetical protein INR49_028085 [Caranx melampygus]|nr:hypothetical protein INR49_028085 [Caranx melampygus]